MVKSKTEIGKKANSLRKKKLIPLRKKFWLSQKLKLLKLKEFQLEQKQIQNKRIKMKYPQKKKLT
jgi:hypothetical protein